MPRLVIFDKIPAGSHTYYEDVTSGAIVQVQPGSQIPARLMVDPEQYAERGIGRIEGVEDGTDGRLDRLMTGLRALLTVIAPLPGAARTWTLNAMVAQARQVQVDDIASRAAFAASEAEAAEAAAAAAAEEAAAAQAASDAAAVNAQEAAATSIEEIKAMDEAGGGTSEVAPL